MKIANDPKFTETWEQLQRDMNALLSGCHTENINRKDFTNALAKVKQDLSDLEDIRNDMVLTAFREAINP